LGTVNRVAGVATITRLGVLGTVNAVSTVGTIARLGILGTVNRVAGVATITRLGVLGTVNAVNTVGTIARLGILGTVNRLAAVGTLTRLGVLGTISGDVNSRIVGSGVYATVQDIAVSSTGTYTNFIDISQYSATGWYIKKISNVPATLTARIALVPSTNRAVYTPYIDLPVGTITSDITKALVLDRTQYLKYAAVNLISSSTTIPTVQVVFDAKN
ncbi:hypothetical protein HGI32_17535, partial [Clostridium acetobutylicum]|nr:hypothetical protein [Clostridium acetobutylicum]